MENKGVVFGKGFLGTRIAQELSYKQAGYDTNPLELENLRDYLEMEKPLVVINGIGKTGRPNIDWCETHKTETVYSNVIAAVNLSMECAERGIYFVHLGSGCVYEGDNNGKGFSEDDEPNFRDSFYSRTKIISEKLLREFPGLILRIRMPIDDRPNPRNLIDKLLSYKKIIDVQNSMTTVPDMIRGLEVLINRRRDGIYNMVNPGVASAKEIMEMYRGIVDSSHFFEIFTLDDLEKVTVARRSNCRLSSEKLRQEGIEFPEIHLAVQECLNKYKEYKR